MKIDKKTKKVKTQALKVEVFTPSSTKVNRGDVRYYRALVKEKRAKIKAKLREKLKAAKKDSTKERRAMLSYVNKMIGTGLSEAQAHAMYDKMIGTQNVSNLYKHNLQKEYNKAVRRYKNRIIYEQAREKAIYKDESPLTMLNPGLFGEANFDFEKVYIEGITRKERGKTVRYSGETGIKTFIESLNKRADPNYMKGMFIKNYIQAMRSNGNFTQEQMSETLRLLRAQNPDTLTYMINTGILPEIPYFYLEGTDTAAKMFDKIKAALDPSSAANKGIQEEMKQVRKETRLQMKVMDYYHQLKLQ